MLPDRVSNPGPLTYESGALPIALRGSAITGWRSTVKWIYTFTDSCPTTSDILGNKSLC